MPHWIRLCLLLVAIGNSPLLLAEPPYQPNPGTIRLSLPPIVPAVVGRECNIYFDNVVLVPNPANVIFDVNCLRGAQLADHWTWVPPAADVGDIQLQLDVRDAENRIIATGRTLLRIIPANQGEGKALTVLCVGDSLTHSSQYTQRLLDRSAEPGNPQMTLIGSHFVGEPGPNRHEGYGGWTARRFATHYTGTARTGEYAKRGSPFLYPDAAGKPELDFTHYCQDINAGKFPDLVTIFLGPNDLFSFTDETIEPAINDVFLNLDLLIAMVHKASPSTPVAIMLPVPPATSQDSFGNNYDSGQTRWQYKRNIHRMVERLLAEYANRPGVLLVPTNLGLDCENNYPTGITKRDAVSSVEVTRQNNSVHPAQTGYFQIGDSLFDWIKGRPTLYKSP